MAAAWSWRASHSTITMTSSSLAILVLLLMWQPLLQVEARRQMANSQEVQKDSPSGRPSKPTSNQTAMDFDDGTGDDDDNKPDQPDLPDLPEKNNTMPTWRHPKKMSVLQTRPSGSLLALSCHALGKPDPNITWYRNGTADWARGYGTVKRNRWTLIMEDLVPGDCANYTCKVCNPLGCIYHNTQLIVSDRVNHRPISIVTPSNLTLVVNGSGKMECKYLSDLTSKKAWIFVPCQGVTNCSNNRSIIAEDQDQLEFVNVTMEQEGWYTCIESNSLGQSNTTAYLRVVRSLKDLEVAGVATGSLHSTFFVYIFIVCGLIFIIMTTLFVFYAIRKMKHEKVLKQRIETVHQWTKKVIIFKPEGGGDSSGSMDTMIMPVVRIQKQRTTVLQNGNEPAPFNEYEFPLDSNWELPRSHLVLGATLGEGAFGRVVMAEVNNAIVAVKMVKEGHTDDDIASLVREMEVMKIIGRHINIINLLGCCSQSGPLYVVVEYAPYGNLKDFLYKNRPYGRDQDCSQPPPSPPAHVITEKDLIKFAHQIARGMDYLASRRCIHRDLAARNVLVSDDYVLKIADFGLARDIQSTDYYRKNTNGRLPIKWMAPESLQEKFYDSKSDVWSYGILLWEIMTYGQQPYPTIMSAEELYSYLMSGHRMEKPAKCSMNIYILMRQCWHFNADDRPPFTEIVEYMDKLLQSKEDYLDVDIANLDTPPSTSDEEADETDNLQKWCNYKTRGYAFEPAYEKDQII
ncbi:LOW QUALITY PROTEIN: fibroblast growth factor receptor homolog 1 [Drosophila ficusphila]|uniref:LOW QUALITY PROTEIN: fibroblast growth factor receptor homolog 1 n=1 Tax=Drosophila ficusphila TaxID=30025 RepID=UPI0007E779D6|nr:LOW QUALITY PROTEIN: fibroblast growth factor receptor homolog 1 [Drosophila ficusphila]